MDEHPHHLLVGAPVAPPHGVGEVNVLVVADTSGDVGEARLHTALGRRGVGPLRGHEGEDDRVETPLAGADGHPQAGETATNHQHVAVDDFHG